MGAGLVRSSMTRGGQGTADAFSGLEMDLYIYQGTQTTDRADGVYYALWGEWTPVVGSTTLDEYSVDIAPYIKDFIQSTYDGTWANSTNDAVWVDYRTRTIDNVGTPSAWSTYKQFECTEGYGYFGETQTLDQSTYFFETADNEALLIESGTTIYIPDGEQVTVPILRNEHNTNYGIIFTDGTNTDLVSATYTLGATITESTQSIGYFTEDGLNDYIRIEQDHPTNPNSVLNYIVRITEYKHTPIKIVFKNKYGALQEMWFFGKTTVTTNTSKNEFNRKNDTAYTGVIDSSVHAKVVYNKMGSENITLNSGFQVEANNELFRQLMLSEYIWMHYEGDVLPVNILDSSIQYKTSISDKLINYTINFEFAFDKILA